MKWQFSNWVTKYRPHNDKHEATIEALRAIAEQFEQVNKTLKVISNQLPK